VLRPGREEPYLCIQDIIIFVRDLELSLRFYVDQLGFELIADRRLPSGEGWIEVAPPDGSANLTLVAPKPDRPEYKLIGGNRWILFMTEDVHAKYKEWSERGVHFLSAPENPAWGGTFTRSFCSSGGAAVYLYYRKSSSSTRCATSRLGSGNRIAFSPRTLLPDRAIVV